MPSKAQNDDLVMSLVELALARAESEREAYLRSACGSDSELLRQVRGYVEWERRMHGFLLEPLYPPASFEHPFQPAQLLEGRFRIVREVAQGGMGVVYEAEDEKLERRIALKCAKAGFRKRLPPEVRHATEISHPNVCKIFEIHTASTEQGEIDFLTMEFLEGETLTERLRRGPLPEPEARAIARQLCAGLAAAHHNHVIHGDLKSSNVILAPGTDGAVRAVITDFGLARPVESDAPSGERGGTPDYMAPELWKGEAPSAASDVYALGVILYELAAGRRPDRSNLSWEERLAWKPSALDPKWDGILARCLEPDPARRFPSAEAVGQALAPGHSRRWMLAAAAAVVLAAGTGVITYERATAPTESVRLAMLPLEAGPDTAALADTLFHEAAAELAQLKGDSHTRLTVIPAERVLRGHVSTAGQARTALGATMVLRGSLQQQNGKTVLHAALTNTQSQVNARDWQAEYTPSEVRYAPVALAGVVSATLRLPALVTQVNSAARADYQAGLADVRRDTGVDDAIPLLERAVAADPGSPLTYAALAEAEWFKYYLTSDKSWLDRATESEREAELRDPDAAAVHRIAGILDFHAGRYELAEAEYRRAIELQPANSDAYRRLGQVLEQNNQFDAALAAYQKAIDLEPQYYRNFQALGAFHVQRGEYTEAAKDFQKTVDLAPGEPSGHISFATALMNLGRYAEAESQLRSAIQVHATALAVHSLGYALMYQGRDQEAIPYFLRALALDHPQKYVAWFELGVAYRRTNQPADAEKANRRGLQSAEQEMARDPRSGYVRSFLAYFCARLNDRSRAESEIAQALALSPNDADTRQMAALTYEVLGQRDDALGVLSASSSELIADLSRWPDAAELHHDPRFLQLLASRQIK